MLMRIAYTAVTYLLSPIYAAYWYIRGIGNRAYRDRFGQKPALRELGGDHLMRLENVLDRHQKAR